MWQMCDYQNLCLCRYPNVSPQSFSQHAAIVRVPNHLPYDHSLFWDIRQFCNAKLEQGELVLLLFLKLVDWLCLASYRAIRYICRDCQFVIIVLLSSLNAQR